MFLSLQVSLSVSLVSPSLTVSGSAPCIWYIYIYRNTCDSIAIIIIVLTCHYFKTHVNMNVISTGKHLFQARYLHYKVIYLSKYHVLSTKKKKQKRVINNNIHVYFIQASVWIAMNVWQSHLTPVWTPTMGRRWLTIWLDVMMDPIVSSTKLSSNFVILDTSMGGREVIGLTVVYCSDG